MSFLYLSEQNQINTAVEELIFIHRIGPSPSLLPQPIGIHSERPLPTPPSLRWRFYCIP
jgi:hypothetical protein